MTQKPETLNLHKFCKRFVDHMVEKGAPITWRSRQAVREYAETVAPRYWAESSPDGVSPELCADEDISYWEKED
jgi:hypothetical protein